MASRRASGALLTYFLVVMVLFGQSMARPSWPFHAEQKYFENENKVIRARLLHIDHQDSPFCIVNSTTSDRVAAAVRRSIARRALIGRRLAGTDFTTPVANSEPLGEYIMKISLGTPAQTFTTIIDTGSDVVWVQCIPCAQCPAQPDPLFDPTLSTSYTNSSCLDPLCVQGGYSCSTDQTCNFNVVYLDGTTVAGTLAQETITVTEDAGATPITGFTFGCTTQHVETNSIGDGLVGFGQGASSLPSQLGTDFTKQFSYCLVTTGDATTVSSSLLFGVPTTPVNGLVYTSMTSNPNSPSFYYVPMTGISVNGADLGIPATTFAIDPTTGNGGIILDSGTTYTSFDNATVTAIVQALTPLISYPELPGNPDFPLCYDLSAVTAPTFPTMSFQFDGVDSTPVSFPLDGDNMFQAYDNQGQYCLAFTVDDSDLIIGNVQQSNHYIEYDLLNQKIGWIQQTC